MDALDKKTDEDAPVGSFRSLDQRDLKQNYDAQVGAGENFVDNFSPMASGLVNQMADESESTREALDNATFSVLDDVGVELGRDANAGVRLLNAVVAPVMSVFATPVDPNYDKEAHRDELLADIPLSMHEDILEHGTYENAIAERNRIINKMKLGQRNGQQQSLFGNMAIMAGSVVDADLPLAAMSGGAYGSAKIANVTLKGAKLAGLSANVAKRTASAATGMNAGLQGGLLAGAVEKEVDATFTWTDLANSALMGMALGGGLNTLVKGDYDIAVREAHKELVKHVRAGKTDGGVNVDAAMPEPMDLSVADIATDTAVATAPKPRVFNAEGEAMQVEVKTAQDKYDDVSADREAATAGRDDPEHQARVAALKKQLGTEGHDLSVGAAQTNPGSHAKPSLPPDPIGNRSARTTQIIENARDSLDDGDYRNIRDRDDAEWWSKVASHPAMNLATRDFRNLHTSKSNVANWMAHNIFESANGLSRGRFTAAAGLEFYHNKIMSPIGRVYGSAVREWTRANGKTWKGSGFGSSKEGLAQFNREVRLELNARHFNRTHTTDPNIKRAADAFEESGQNALGILRGRDGQKAVDGFEQVKDRAGYSPYVWSGSKILALERAGTITRKGVIQSVAAGYKSAGIQSARDAEVIAKAVVDRALAKDNQIDTNLLSLLSGDGRVFLQDSLKREGMSDVRINELMDRLSGKVEDSKRESFAKERNEIDLSQTIPTTDGSDIRVVDLQDNDLFGTWQNYARRASGSAALARVGITNRAQRDELVTALQSEQRALGEDVSDAEHIHAMLSHFNGGPVHGFSRLSGKNEGIGQELTVAKRLTGLALLGKLGFAQMAETGTQMATQGMVNWWKRGPMARFDAELKAGNEELLNDIAFITGDLGREHIHMAPHLDLDDVSKADQHHWLASVSRLTSKGQFIQNYTSLFNHVRGFQQKTAALGMADKVFRTLDDMGDLVDLVDADGSTLARHSGLSGTELKRTLQTVRRFQSDLGLTHADLSMLKSKIDDGTVEFVERGGRKYVNRLNLHKWDANDADLFAAALIRNTNQVVQKSMAGEADAWLHTSWGSVMTHLKTFPLQALQKQFIRNMRHSDPQTLATVLMGFSTAMLAMTVRDGIEGRERTTSERAKIAFGYSNTTSWVPMAVDPTMTMLGLEDYRINAFGPYSTYTPAIVTQMNRMGRLIGSTAKEVAGVGDGHTRDSIKALPFMNTLGLSRVLD